MRLTFLLYLQQFMLINVNIVPSRIFAIVIYVKHMVATMLVLRVNLLVLKLFVNLYLLWAVINLLFFLQFARLFTLIKFVLVKLFVAVLAVKSSESSKILVNLLNHLLRANLFVLVMLVWLKNLTLSITV